MAWFSNFPSNFKIISEIFWHERFWLPGNTTWSHLYGETTKDIYYPKVEDLIWCIPIAIIINLIRYCVERCVFKQIGLKLGLKDKIIRPYTVNKHYESIYKRNKHPEKKQLLEIASTHQVTPRTVEQWFRQRRNFDKSSLLKKFCESGWRFCFYLISFWVGLYVHLDKIWFYDLAHTFRGHPFHSVPRDIYFYYLIEFSYYCSCLLSIFSDVKRKDFMEMLIHHVATICLIFFSWAVNFVRIGSLVLCLHDAVDYWMEFSKMAKYVKYNVIAYIGFLTFTLVWIATRLVIFPGWIIYATAVIARQEMTLWPSYYVFNALIFLLQILHIIWFVMICRIIGQIFIYGEIKKDCRSESELSDD